MEQLKNVKIDSPDEIIILLDKLDNNAAFLQQENNISYDFVNLLQIPNADVKTKVAKCIADITKSDGQRKHFTDTIIIEPLVAGISNLDADTTNMDLIVQISRALGNICYQNNDARDILIQIDGDQCIINLLDVDCGHGDKATTDELFINVRCGLISNLLVGGETVSKRAIEHNIMDKIEVVLAKCLLNVEANDNVLLSILSPLSILTENVPDLNFKPTLNKQLVKILAESINPDIAEICLDLLHYQAENG